MGKESLSVCITLEPHQRYFFSKKRVRVNIYLVIRARIGSANTRKDFLRFFDLIYFLTLS